jgi:2-pyrone-4,6-dicarboxylate lactonase
MSDAVTLDAVASSGGAYRGVARVDDAVTDLELRRLHEGGIRGIRFNLVRQCAAGVPAPGRQARRAPTGLQARGTP